MLHNMKLVTKLSLGFGFIILLMGILGLFALQRMGVVNDQSTIIAENWMPSIKVVEEINTYTSDLRIEEYRHVLSQTHEAMQQAEVEMKQIIDAMSKDRATYEKLISSAEEQAIYDEFSDKFDQYMAIHERLMTVSRQNQTEEAMTILREGADIFNDYSSVLLRLVKMNVEGGQTASSEGDAIYVHAQKMVIGVIAAGLLLGVLIAIVIIKDIMRRLGAEPNEVAEIADQVAAGNTEITIDLKSGDTASLKASMKKMVESLANAAALAEQIADGNLNVKVQLASEKDKLGQALQKMTRNLNEVLGDISNAGEQIASSSMQISDASQSLSQGATESASSLEEITASMSQIGSQTKQTAENAVQANRLAAEAKEAAETGNRQMEGMVSAMFEINQAGQNISKIIKVIDEIAFQTNLLALNAAVEAARAGQHGKGFAVVAEEVRTLAARSAKAARETAELIEGSVQKTQNGTEIAGDTEKALKDIVSGVLRVSDLVGEIAAAATEQAEGIAQVNTGLEQIDQVTQQNTANAEESAAAAEELSAQADEMHRMLGRFKLDGRSGGKQVKFLPAPDSTSGPVDHFKRKMQVSERPAPTNLIALNDAEYGKY